MKVVLKDLTKIFPSRNKKEKQGVTAVDHFNIEIPDGKLVGLLGPSGCGKSTALNLISGLETPTEGKIFFGDVDVTDLPPENRGVGLVFQNYALYPHMTVRQNIMFPLENLKGDAKLSKEQMEERVQQAADLVQIGTLMERKPAEMSGGQQQRVAIARAIVKYPDVLLLDEPLSNLDARLRLQTREEIRRIQRETGITTIFVTHDQEEAMSISDFIIVMRSGRIHQVGKPQNVYDDPVDLFVATFLGTPQINVFEGEVKDEKLFIGDAEILDVKGARNGKVWACIRPEGFIPDPKGPLVCHLNGVEVMGRDSSVVATHPADTAIIRAIVSSESEIDKALDTVSFSLKPYKVHLFDRETEERIRFDY
ncbi:MAG: ABC transporter ATP-binding protein [Erysipelotrichaceae bacterium]|nr:ABC transporter ATP-binding protein [Erysipelotrichaceae bacterium]MBQ3412454.1 ABC transporter ATP-binding protein [Oscillospiraceae bacterium]